MLSHQPAARIPVAISGIGMITPCGPDRESSWRELLAGQSSLRWLTDAEHTARGCDISRTRLAGAPAILPSEMASDAPFLMEAMSVCASHEAIEDAGLDLSSFDKSRCGIVIGTSKGSLSAWQHLLSGSGEAETDAKWRNLWQSGCANSPALAVAKDQQIRGPVLVPVAACATGLLSILRGVQLIQDGQCDVVLAGSVDDSLTEILWASYRRLGVLAKVQDADPRSACRPYDLNRGGFLMGSGAAVVVLERMDQAIGRGHQPYAEWLAGGILSDAQAITQVSRDAAGLTRLIGDVLRRGEIQPENLDYINLHGTGTIDNDRYETLGIRQALGSNADSIPCSSLKGTIGHLLGGAGSVEFAAMLLAMRDGFIPPTANLTEPDPECDLDYTPVVARHHDIEVALKLSLGFGGHLVAGLVRNCRG